MFTWVRTVCTIAQSAAKPATFLPPTPVATDFKSIHLQIDADARLAAAAGGAARYFGDLAGIENDALAHLQAATVAACVDAFAHLTQLHPYLDVTLTRLADRIEIALSYEGEGNSARGPNPKAGLAGRSSPKIKGIDSVRHESRGTLAVTLLTKYVAPRNAPR
jgi:hypothetical protein